MSTAKQDHLRFLHIVYIGNLFERWPGAGLYRFRALIREALLTPYRYEITDISNDGKVEHVCFADVDMQEFLSGKSRLPDYPVVFNLEEVERLEGLHPQLKLGKTKKVKWGKAAHQAGKNELALEQWRRAIADASLTVAARIRLEIWLKRIKEEKVSVLEAEYPKRNIQRDVRDARKRDVPALKRQYFNLPDLEG